MAANGTLGPDTRPLVSVVMPVYNGERFLAEAIESVVSQTYEHWELLLVDDGSTDLSREIGNRYAARHEDRMRVLEHPGHRGLPLSRNLGIAHAQGDFVAGLDSDDVWLPQRLEHQVRLAIEHPDVGMVCGPSWYWFSWTGLEADREIDTRRELKVEYDRRYEPPELLRMLLLEEMHSPTTGAALIRRALLTEVGGYVEDFPAMYEDQVMLAKVLLETPVYVSGDALDRYRQHDSSITALAGRSIADIHVPLSRERRVFLEWVSEYVNTRSLGDDPGLQGALRSALAPFQSLWRYRSTHPAELARWAGSKVLPAQWQRALWRVVRRRRSLRETRGGR